MDQPGTSTQNRPPLWIRVPVGLFRIVTRLLVIAIFLAAGFFVGGFLNYIHTITSYPVPDTVERADAIIVPTGGSQRIAAALELLANDKGNRLLITGVDPQTPDRSLRRRHTEFKALFDCCVDTERAAIDTIGNASAAQTWMAEQEFTSAIVVTSGYHMPRTLLEFRRTMPEISFRQAAVPLQALLEDGWWTQPETLRLVTSEYLKYLGAILRGHIDAQSFSTFRSSMTGR